mgnify:FL=1
MSFGVLYKNLFVGRCLKLPKNGEKIAEILGENTNF